MSKFDDLDGELLRLIRMGYRTFAELQSRATMRMAQDLATPNYSGYRDGSRVIDRRLQALRKKGLITFTHGHGWGIAEERP